MFLLTIIGQFTIVCCELHFVYTFSCVCWIYVAEVLIIYIFATTTI